MVPPNEYGSPPRVAETVTVESGEEVTPKTGSALVTRSVDEAPVSGLVKTTVGALGATVSTVIASAALTGLLIPKSLVAIVVNWLIWFAKSWSVAENVPFVDVTTVDGPVGIVVPCSKKVIRSPGSARPVMPTVVDFVIPSPIVPLSLDDSGMRARLFGVGGTSTRTPDTVHRNPPSRRASAPVTDRSATTLPRPPAVADRVDIG